MFGLWFEVVCGFRLAYIRTSDALSNVTVTLKSSTGFWDVYYVPDDLEDDFYVSAYSEIPAAG